MEQTTTTPNPQQETQSSNQQELSSGVIRKNQGLTDSIKYIIPTSGLSKIKDPEAREVYLKDKIKTVTRDAKKQGDLEKTTLEFEGDNPIAFREETNKLCKKSIGHQLQYEGIQEKIEKIAGITGAVITGITAYYFASEPATNIANHMNNTPLLAGITGLVQSGIALGSAVVGAIAGAILIQPLSKAITSPINNQGFPLRKDMEDYRAFTNVMNRQQYH